MFAPDSSEQNMAMRPVNGTTSTEGSSSDPAPANGAGHGDSHQPQGVPLEVNKNFRPLSENGGANGTPQTKIPAQVEPIGPMPHIPKIPPISGLQIPPNLLQLAARVAGKKVDESGNVVDETGRVFGRTAGDLPAMVGRTVSPHGIVLGDNGDLLGYVCQVEEDTGEDADETEEGPSGPPPPKELDGTMAGMKVDYLGNILDSQGNIVGHFNKPPTFESTVKNADKSSAQSGTSSNQPKQQQKAPGDNGPSDVFLDVKSTTEGIQLTIRIPTCFGPNGQQPQIRFA